MYFVYKKDLQLWLKLVSIYLDPHQVHKRLKCDDCGQEMCNSFILKRHKAKVHGVIPENAHQCKLCPMFFSSKVSLGNHMGKIHPEVKG